MGEDDMVCHAAWVSNFGDTRRDPDKIRPVNDLVYDYDTHKYSETQAIKKWDFKTQGLINFLYQNRHNSPFEHAAMTFYIETPIFVAREFMRHRTWSYNEMS